MCFLPIFFCLLVITFLTLALFAPSGWAGQALNWFVSAAKWLWTKFVGLFKKEVATISTTWAADSKASSATEMQVLVNKSLHSNDQK